MACVTLKRPLEFDPIHSSPGGSSCSPRPHKRRRCLPMCIPASQVNTATTSSFNASSFASLPSSSTAVPSPFANAAPALLQGDIAQYVREEIRRLKRRRLLQGVSQHTYSSLANTDEESTRDSSSSPSDSPPRITSPPLPCSSSSTLLPSSPSSEAPPSIKNKPLFTFKQVVHLCSQLLREREGAIREEYEKVLSQRKAEQYDCFVRFTADQLQPAFPQQHRPTYLS
ncbi:akirin-2 [Hyalella azteca]|uniref:Akirin-2 n=1 Tax=Hyalella azteca TaxID=294128 RepID=A0A8B7NUN1_HYAAZ|nr:akirin-2 [Hyalella azteca]XP_018017468.1 akirin-2 [Hyalella azteca]XP_018017470.1 akirin-2 [Hyalella azteca]